jgi:DNA-directed RNA polymerase subunit N (RpoN/RPB10)
LEENESILHQPLGELLRREISVEFLKKELTIPEFLKKEIPLGILDKEIHFRRVKTDMPYDSSVVEQTRCFSCGKDTPATVATCLHCGAHIEATYKLPSSKPSEDTDEGYDADVSLIDVADDLL